MFLTGCLLQTIHIMIIIFQLGCIGIYKYKSFTMPRCFLEQETLHLLLSTGWLQEQIQA